MSKIIHIDLFAGIGGFSYAIDCVFGKENVKHIFVEIDPFCQAVLKKHWNNSQYYGDIREYIKTLIANTKHNGRSYSGSLEQKRQDKNIKNGENKKNKQVWKRRKCKFGEAGSVIANAESGKSRKQTEQERRESVGGGDKENKITKNAIFRRCLYGKQKKQIGLGDKRDARSRNESGVHILTGGFPCQPFSVAGQRRGTQDNRYLWPEMFRVIQLTKPQWIIAENVSGILTIEQGMVFEQACLDLESEGYEVQPFIIPAVSVNAPHRRDRVWIIANKSSKRLEGCNGKKGSDRCSESNTDTQNSNSQRGRGRDKNRRQILESKNLKIKDEGPNWERNWVEVATELCGMDDGLSAELDGLKLSKSAHRRERLKALGNAIVPQVAIEIMKAIKMYYN